MGAEGIFPRQSDPEITFLTSSRVTPGHGYLEALTASNVDVVTSGIEKITKNGIITRDGELVEVDVIITATGYDTSFVPRFPIIGLDGVNLQDKWRDEGAAAYLAVAVPGFPNYFRKLLNSIIVSLSGLFANRKIVTTGPNAPISNGSLIGAIERQLDYALNFVQKIQSQDLRSVVVTKDAAKEFDEWKNEFMKNMSWSGSCTSWYKNGTTDGNVIGKLLLPSVDSGTNVNRAMAGFRQSLFRDYEDP